MLEKSEGREGGREEKEEEGGVVKNIRKRAEERRGEV